jgi:alanyl-tRNA synthetase
MLEEEVAKLRGEKKTVVSGGVVFKLYDTYGFPVDLTADIVKKEGLTVDEAGFTEEMELQRERGRKAWRGEEAADIARFAGLSSEFIGYDTDVSSSRVVALFKEGKRIKEAVKGDAIEVVTDATPFYGESGGQAGDTGVMFGKGATLKVLDTKRPLRELTVHIARVGEGAVHEGATLELAPSRERRLAIRRNHTATHLLHAALRETLGTHIRQAGSLVSEDSLRFDFNHFSALTGKELLAIENKINDIIRQNIEVMTETLPYETAVERGALAFFGEKYGTTVRVVEIKGVSRELCGGTHAKRTGEIGLFKITSEASVAAGIRRIEAITAERALHELNEAARTVAESAFLLKTTKRGVTERIRALLEREKELHRKIEELKRAERPDKAGELVAFAKKIGAVNVICEKVAVEGPEELRALSDALRERLKSAVVILAAECEGKAVLLAAVTKDLLKTYNAGEIIKKIAPMVGGRGGGKADFAQAGGARVDKIEEALREALRMAGGG